METEEHFLIWQNTPTPPAEIPMKQMTFADAEYAGKRKLTRRELFLIEMARVVP
jgi:IS5 family transposase